jgi:hypothetical protein
VPEAYDHMPVAKRFKNLYGEVLARRGFTMVPNDLGNWIAHLGLTEAQYWLIVEILKWYRDGEWPSVSLREVARGHHIGRKTLEKRAQELEALGYLVRSGRSRFGSSFFDLSGLLTRLAQIADVEQVVGEIKTQAGQVVDKDTDWRAIKEAIDEQRLIKWAKQLLFAYYYVRVFLARDVESVGADVESFERDVESA